MHRAGAQLVQALQTVVSRNLHPCESAVVSVTQFHAGEAWNVIPEEVVLRGTIRSFNPEVQGQVERAIEQLCSGIAALPVNLFEDVPKTELQEVFALWQDAFEWSYYDEVLAGIEAIHKEQPNPAP